METSIQVGGWKAERKSEIAAISNKYKNTPDDLIDSSDIESPIQTEFSDWLKPIDKGIRNARKSGGALLSLAEEDSLNKNVSVTLFGLAPKI